MHTQQPVVGVVGVGNMGAPMAARLLDLGYRVVVRDVRSEATALLGARGAAIASTSAEVAAQADVLLIVVVDAGQIDDVLFAGPAPAAPVLRAGTLVCLHSTIAPADTARIAGRLAEGSVQLVDAPVSGGPARARDGSLSMMVAGSAAALELAAPVLASLARRIFPCGDRPGAAATVKLINNQLAAVNLAAGAEALALAERAGLDPRLVASVVAASSGQSWIVSDRYDRWLAGDRAPRAHASVLAKDVALACRMAESFDAPARMAAAAAACYRAAIAAGLGHEDDAILLELARRSPDTGLTD